MNIEDFNKLKIGDRIQFRVLTRSGRLKRSRQITHFPLEYDYDRLVNGEFPRSTEMLTVRFDGCANFYIKRTEIIRRIHEHIEH